MLEELHGGLSLFVLGACGDTMPVQGHQGDPAVTERDGRRVGYAAAEALEGLLITPGTKLKYIRTKPIRKSFLPENLLEATDGLLRPLRRSKGATKHPVSDLLAWQPTPLAILCVC